MTSLDAFGDSTWPPFTSHIALELFKRPATIADKKIILHRDKTAESSKNTGSHESKFSEPMGKARAARKKVEDYSEEDQSLFDDYFVRIRYNDDVMVVPGCAEPGSHLEGDKSFCTLVRQ